ncbi:putative thebaine 6-O-demethylase [Helianthus annuus]|nr:putative thebaine 6-O-demethylase [Helianthus annuus]
MIILILKSTLISLRKVSTQFKVIVTSICINLIVNHSLICRGMVESQSGVTPVNRESVTIQVHQIAANYDQLPERFICKEDEEYGNITKTVESSQTEIPVIDVSLLTSSHLELDRLKTALTTWGCFQAINHGIEGPLLDKVREISRLFFNLSAEEKKKCLREEGDVEGYGNDMVLSDHQTLDWTDRLFLSVLPEDQQRLQFWPQNPTNFREVVDKYCSKVELINEVIFKAMSRSLNLEENCFLDQYGTTNSKILGRFNYYPPCPWADKVLGLKPHSDGSAITFLLQDKGLEGLQILKDGQWFGVPIVPDALTINVGDQMEPDTSSVRTQKDQRITVAMFCMPQTEKDIGPIDGLITDDTPRLYKNVTFSLDFYLKNYQEGTRSIDACKI